MWHRHGAKEATWEPEDSMRQQYPNLFNGKIFEDKILKGENCNSPTLTLVEIVLSGPQI